MYKIIGGDGKEYGPISADQLRDWLAQGRLNAQSRVQAEGSPDWKALLEFPELAAMVAPPPMAPAAVVPQKTSGLAIASLVLGILGFCSYGITSLIGLVLGLVSFSKINKSAGTLGGKGLAIAGISVSGVTLLLFPILIAIAIPSFVRAKNAAQAHRVLNTARQMNTAIDQWALETGKRDGTPVNTTEAAAYLKDGWKNVDLFGNSYLVSVVGSNQLKISPATKRALKGIGIDWGQF